MFRNKSLWWFHYLSRSCLIMNIFTWLICQIFPLEHCYIRFLIATWDFISFSSVLNSDYFALDFALFYYYHQLSLELNLAKGHFPLLPSVLLFFVSLPGSVYMFVPVALILYDWLLSTTLTIAFFYFLSPSLKGFILMTSLTFNWGKGFSPVLWYHSCFSTLCLWCSVLFLPFAPQAIQQLLESMFLFFCS